MLSKSIITLLRSLAVFTIIITLIGLYYDAHILGISVTYIFWFLMIPMIVAIMYLAPGLWRNICPLASTNLTYYNLVHKKKLEEKGKDINILPGLRGKSHDFLRKRGAIISSLLFWTIVPLRLIFFHDDNIATLIIVVSLFSVAFIMGIIFPVKSGWCTSICPLFAVEKAYSINPAFKVKNTRCEYIPKGTSNPLPCSGCSFNCVDIIGYERSYIMENLTKTHHDTTNAFMRKFFISTFPGFMVGYFSSALNYSFFSLFPIPNVLVVYFTILFSMALSYLVYETIKSLFRKNITHVEGELTMEKPNPHYALLKRRLDLIWVAFSVTIAWSVFTFATFYPLSSSLFSSLVGVIVVVLSLLTILTLSTFFIVKGWNDTLTTQEASWF